MTEIEFVMSTFWNGLMQSHGVRLLRFITFSPQTDGPQTENLNKSIEVYLRCATGRMPKEEQII